MRRLLAAAVIAVALPGAAHAAAGPRCQVGGNPVVGGSCLFGAPEVTGLHVAATATGLPGLTRVHIVIYALDDVTHTYSTALECTGTSSDATDTTADCEASTAWSGVDSFACLADGSVTYSGTCDSTVPD